MRYGICQYCKKQKQLCSAHIVPKSFYNQKENGNFIGLSNDGKRDLKNCQNGFKDDSILCADCDKILGVYDKYAKEVLYEILPRHRRFDTPLFLLTHDFWDYQKLRMFFISLVWRASISQIDACQQISIGKKYEEIALAILKNEIPDNDMYFHPVILKRTKDYRFPNIVMLGKGKYAGQWKSNFIFPGYAVDIITNISPIKNDFVIKRLSMNKAELAVVETNQDITHNELPILSIIKTIKTQ